ncbi:hypothetical protein [Desulfovibrio litoralis]|uniref:Response regulatory domain-containing protein n=1 Tax=Desulfovibrio litoralis DSM 11393 TaxID=1121455 RepID=A0A1M7RR51_9BACT|nr:hypothetical protein [Desulfovibrio litoralis]SHN48572.1 hypothetical protein SAMN02745728_00009 [Desulfovibrio litoralis DSM 11393]
MKVLIVTKRLEFWEGVQDDFSKYTLTMGFVSTIKNALEFVKATPPVLIILDQVFSDIPNLSETENEKALRGTLTDILMINAMIHSVVVTDMDKEIFHELTEGLGILLALPVKLNQTELQKLFDALSEVQVLTQSSNK